MADKRDEIDLTTLEAVRRVLASTEFASIDDLVARTGSSAIIEPLRSGARPSGAPAGDSEGLDPLPRRR